MIPFIGFETESQEITAITNGVFLVLFFNTGLLLMLVNANLSDVSGFLSTFLDSTFYDYSPAWYAKVGNIIVSTMIINAIFPPVFEAVTVGMSYVQQAWDSGMWRCRTNKY